MNLVPERYKGSLAILPALLPVKRKRFGMLQFNLTSFYIFNHKSNLKEERESAAFDVDLIKISSFFPHSAKSSDKLRSICLYISEIGDAITPHAQGAWPSSRCIPPTLIFSFLGSRCLVSPHPFPNTCCNDLFDQAIIKRLSINSGSKVSRIDDEGRAIPKS